jgi:hypothetical protein
MRTGSELLGRERDALVPLSATLVARPVRVCVFVPLYPEVPWEASVEHAIACQARYWGGHASLVVPVFDGLAADEVFWRLVRQYDPDLIGLHAPTLETWGRSRRRCMRRRFRGFAPPWLVMASSR